MFQDSRSSSHNAMDQRVETAKSIDDPMISQLITRRRGFPDYDMFDAVIASELKRVLDKHVRIRKRVKYDGFHDQ